MIRSPRGFTLIEVLITMAIMAALTILATQSIQQAIKSKVKIQDQVDDVSRMRDALRLLQADINLAFHYRDVEKELSELIKKSGGQQGVNTGAPRPPGFPATPTNPTVNPGTGQAREVERIDPVTQFMGNNESFNLVTMNNARTVRNLKQADFIEVGYSLKSCKSLAGEQGSSQCLWRRSTPWVDDDVTKGGDEVVLLENVSEFKVRYIGKGKDDWTSEWRSDVSGDPVTKNNFPQAVEISLSVEKSGANGRKKKYSMQIVAEVHFPNNEEAKNANNPTGAQGTQGP